MQVGRQGSWPLCWVMVLPASGNSSPLPSPTTSCHHSTINHVLPLKCKAHRPSVVTSTQLPCSSHIATGPSSGSCSKSRPKKHFTMYAVCEKQASAARIAPTGTAIMHCLRIAPLVIAVCFAHIGRVLLPALQFSAHLSELHSTIYCLIYLWATCWAKVLWYSLISLGSKLGLAATYY